MAGQAVRDRQWIRIELAARLHEMQRYVFLDRSRWKSITCSRRAGKTELDSSLLVDGAVLAGDGEDTVYVAESKAIAKTLIWDKLKSRLRELGLSDWAVSEQDLSIRTPWGSRIFLFGAKGSDHAEARDKMRGLKMRRCIYDEPATYADVLEPLTRDVVEPALGDCRGDLIVNGTPGVVLAGWWYEVSTGRGKTARKKWQRHFWTVRDNPFFRDSEAWLAEVLEENRWDEENPTYQREYLGRWIADDSDLVYRWLDARNGVDSLPDDYDGSWNHTVGLDFGVERDASSWTVLASHPHRKEIYVVSSNKAFGKTPAEVADITHELIGRIKPDRVVADTGGLGAAYVAEYARRFGVQLKCADKLGKRAHIELLNGELRSGSMRIVRPTCQDLISEVEILPWANERREREHASYANDCADSLLYAFMEHRAYLHEAPKPRSPTRLSIASRLALEDDLAEQIAGSSARPFWDR
jgi:phage terminase large subunit